MSNFARTIEDFQRSPQPFRALAASGQLGYGIPEPAFKAGVARQPHVIGADMGSVDPGPYYLGSGRMATAHRVTRRDLSLVLNGALAAGIPLVIGTAGTAGADTHLEATIDIVREIAAESGLRFKLATIGAEIPGERVKQALRNGQTRPLGNIAELTESEIDSAERIVGQMGTEAFVRAIDQAPDVIIAGRACDTSIYAALPARLGLAMGPAMHMAKIIECASLCCLPGGRDALLGTLDGEAFELESMNPTRRATPMSVAAHALYEQGNPYLVHEPEGVLDLEHAEFEALDERRCRVSGAQWQPTNAFSVKLEGSTRVGARAVYVAGSADPVFIDKADEIAAGVEALVRELVPPKADKPYSLNFRFYGLGAVSGQPVTTKPEEVGIIVECIGENEEEARAVVASAKQYLLHFGFPGRLSTAGNLAFPFTPPEMTAGDAYRFSIYHVMQVDELAPLFPVTVQQIG